MCFDSMFIIGGRILFVFLCALLVAVVLVALAHYANRRRLARMRSRHEGQDDDEIKRQHELWRNKQIFGIKEDQLRPVIEDDAALPIDHRYVIDPSMFSNHPLYKAPPTSES